MLPDGLHYDVFEKPRPHFKFIDRARDNLLVYALISLESDRTLRTLSPIRHYVMTQPPVEPKLHDVLCIIYFGIADQLPLKMDEHFKARALIAGPEIGNLSSLLIMLVERP